jgi:hypothetical protein
MDGGEEMYPLYLGDADGSGGEEEDVDPESREIDYSDESSSDSEGHFDNALGIVVLNAIQAAVAGVHPGIVAMRGGAHDPEALRMLQDGNADAVGVAAMLAGEIPNRRREAVVGAVRHQPVMPYLNYCEMVRDERDAGFAALCDKMCTVCHDEMSPSADMVCKMPGNAHEHYFHVACLEPWLNPRDGEPRNTCPTCRGVVHVVTGPQPLGGEMHQSVIPRAPEGFPHGSCRGSIQFDFYLPAGCAPCGRMHCGLRAQCYLPNTDDCLELAKLLFRAWDQRLLFRVADDGSGRVVLNGIELKNTLYGGGVLSYPDANYPYYLRDKLKSLGIE